MTSYTWLGWTAVGTVVVGDVRVGLLATEGREVMAGLPCHRLAQADGPFRLLQHGTPRSAAAATTEESTVATLAACILVARGDDDLLLLR